MQNFIKFRPSVSISEYQLPILQDEEPLYEDAGRMLNFLNDWSCLSNDTAACAESLAEEFALNNFWGRADAEIARLWNEDLRRLNYRFPFSSRSSQKKLFTFLQKNLDVDLLGPNLRELQFF